MNAPARSSEYAFPPLSVFKCAAPIPPPGIVKLRRRLAE